MNANHDPDVDGYPIWVIDSVIPPTETRQYPTLTMVQYKIRALGGSKVWLEGDQLLLGAPDIEAKANDAHRRVGLQPVEHPTESENPGLVVHILEFDGAGNVYLKPVVLKGANGWALWKDADGVLHVDASRLGITDLESVISTIEDWRMPMPAPDIPD